jgi:hypothetical protein
MPQILQSRRKTLLLIGLIIIGAFCLWHICSDSADCDYRPSPTNGNQTSTSLAVPSPLTKSGNISPSELIVDEDRDGLDDFEEDRLAERFAPIVYHGQCEPNYPISVDWLLARTGLYEYDNDAKLAKRETVKTLTEQSDLLKHSFATKPEQMITSDSARSECKRASYFLATVNAADQAGARDRPRDWVTYVHSYANQRGGITIQYWRCYAYNQARFIFDFSHGGDWEAVAVHLGSTLRPETVSFLGHTEIEYKNDLVQWEGEHPKVWSEEGSHASLVSPAGMKSKRFTRQETWSGGQVIWWDGATVGASGGLLNVGEKSKPRNGQVFVQYSGLWGSPGMLFITSGYWGPAFNETDALCSNGQKAYRKSPNCTVDATQCERIFHKAWCDGMDARLLDLNIECYAQDSSR